MRDSQISRLPLATIKGLMGNENFIPLDMLDQPLIVIVPKEAIQGQERVSVELTRSDGQGTSRGKFLDAGDMSADVELEFTPDTLSRLKGSVVFLSYAVAKRTENGSAEIVLHSPRSQYVFDGISEGNGTGNRSSNALEAATIKEATADNSVTLETLRRGVNVVIPWSEDFQAEDTLTLILSASQSGGVYHNLNIADYEPGTDLHDFFSPEEIRNLWDAEVTLYYHHFFDGGVEGSPFSEYDFAAALYRPRVNGLVEGVLPWEQAARGFTVTIPAYENMFAGDLIRLFLIGQRPNSSAILETTVTEPGKQIDFLIDEARSYILSGGNVNLHYHIISTNTDRSARSTSFMLESLVSAPIAKYIVQPASFTPFVMDRVDEPAGYYPFLIDFGTPLERDDEIFFLSLDPRAQQNAVNLHIIEQPARSVEILVSKEIIDQFVRHIFLITTLLRRQGHVLASNTNEVFFLSETSDLRLPAGRRPGPGSRGN